MRSIPPEALQGPLTAEAAEALGVSRQMLRGRRFRRMFRGFYATCAAELTIVDWTRAALMVLPNDAAASHLTALRLRGVEVGPAWPQHFSTNSKAQVTDPRIILHRRRAHLHPDMVQRVTALGADRAFVDSATIIGHRDLVIAGDWLIHGKHTTRDVLVEFCLTRHFDGVRRARRAVAHVREGVESPRETVVRLQLVFARLPEPLINYVITNANGEFLARGDLVYPAYQVVVEYDGWQHHHDARQRQRDRERREQLEAAGWRVIVVTSQDLQLPRRIPLRVYAALKDHGYDGPYPQMSSQWDRWFSPRQDL